MQIEPFAVIPGDYDRPLRVIDERITVLASNGATKGYEVFLHAGSEGAGPPPHSHDWDETFYVLKGKVEFKYAAKAITCPPGTLVHLPAGTVHGFCFGAGGGEMIGITGEGGFASRMFANVDKEISPGAPDIPRLIELLRENGVAVAA